MLYKKAKDLLLKAKKDGYAIPAFDFIDLDSCRSLCKTAEELKKPLILSYPEVHSKLLSLDEAALIGKFLAEHFDALIVLHLDHGQSIESCCKAVDLGFSSVMIDASMKEFDENVRITSEVVKYAHQKGVQVEAELGHVGSNDISSDNSLYTEPDEAKRFVSLTGCDSLAISMGTSHGAYKNGSPKLNFDVLHSVKSSLSDTPLVLHGGSGTGDDNLSRCAAEGITKINIFTDLIIAAQKSFVSCKGDYLSAKKSADKAMEKVAIHYYEIFGTR